MQLDKIPVRVLDALIEDAGYDEATIIEFSPKEVFNVFCNWEGLLGWGDTLWDIQTDLKREE